MPNPGELPEVDGLGERFLLHSAVNFLVCDVLEVAYAENFAVSACREAIQLVGQVSR